MKSLLRDKSKNMMQDISKIYRSDMDTCPDLKIKMLFMLDEHFNIPEVDQSLLYYYQCKPVVNENWPNFKVVKFV